MNEIIILQSAFGYMVRIMGVCVPTYILYIQHTYIIYINIARAHHNVKKIHSAYNKFSSREYQSHLLNNLLNKQ